MLGYRFLSVTRTRGIKTAVIAQEGAYQIAVNTY